MGVIKKCTDKSKEASKLSLPLFFYTINLFYHLPIHALSYVESWEFNSLKAHRKRLTNEETLCVCVCVCVVRGGGAQGEWLSRSLG